MTLATDQLDQLAIDTIRTLSIDGVQQANSGHPGAPMGAAPMAYALWTRHLRHAPTNPHWPNRDRFVLSARPRVDAPVLAAPPDRLRGEPRRPQVVPPVGLDHAGPPGVRPDARASRRRPARSARASATPWAWRSPSGGSPPSSTAPATSIVDHRTYVIASDGDMQEGVASEASSIAGHLRLGKLIVLYDDNRIQLDGPTAWAFSEDVLGRYAAYGWHTQRVEDGNDVAAISAAIDGRQGRRAAVDHRGPDPSSATAARTSRTRRRRTERRSGPDEVRLVKEAYGWDPDRTFYVPDEAGALFRRAIDEGKDLVAEWESRLDRYADGVPGRRRRAGAAARSAACPTAGTRGCPPTRSAPRSRPATRARTRSRRSAGSLPELFGGSADLSESNLTDVKANGTDHFEAEHAGPQPPVRRPRARRWARSSTASPTTAASSPTARRS